MENRHRQLHPLSLFLPLLLLLVGGCCHHPLAPGYAGPKPMPAELSEAFSYPKFNGEFSERIRKKRQGYTVRKIEFQSTHNVLPIEHRIRIDYYDIDGNEPVPVVMVLPILGGGNSISRDFATYFAEHGFAAVIVHRQEEYKAVDHLNEIDLILRQMVFDHKQAIDWIETQQDLDTARIGVFGVSMGGIKSVLVAALETRVRASVVALAAGDIPYVLTHSSERGLVKKRQKILRRESLTLEELHGRLEKIISCDPMNYAEYIDANKVLMVLARFDDVVPFRKGQELKERMGHPETIYLPAGHYTAIFYIHFIKYKALAFFKDKFHGPGPAEGKGEQVAVRRDG